MPTNYPASKSPFQMEITEPQGTSLAVKVMENPRGQAECQIVREDGVVLDSDGPRVGELLCIQTL
jgi:hypothetical protein